MRLSFTAMNGLGKTSRCRVAGKRRSRNDNFGIRISSKLRWSRRLWMGTLIHELVHLEQQLKYSCGPRGKKFNRRILELAVAGAFDGLW